MIKACIFDLDGTLLDTLTTISYYGNMALKEFGFPTIEKAKYKYMVGNGAKILVKRMLEELGAYSEEMHEKVFLYYNEQYNADVTRYTEPYDGILELLKNIKKENLLTAILSNKPDFATKGVAKQLLRDNLPDVIRGQVEGVPVKPDPAGAFEVLKQLNVSPEECIYVGDTSVDMQTGKKLGAYTIGVLWGFRDYEELKNTGADLIVEHPSEIFEYIKKING